MPCFAPALRRAGPQQTDIGFWCSGSSDYLAGRAFSFISAIDSIGAVPPINESHVEMDAAWALYEAYIKLLTGEVDTALVYGFGKSSAGTLRRVLALQTDPYTRRTAVAGLGVDGRPAGALRARRRQVDSRADGPGGAGFVCGRRSGPIRRSHREEHRRTACPAVLRRSVAPPRHRPDHRRRLGDRAGRRRPGPRTAARTRPGSPVSSTASRPRCWVRGT